MGGEVRKPKVSLFHDYQNGITNEEEDIIFITEPKLFSIGTISLPKTIESIKTIDMKIMDINVNTSILEHGFKLHNKKNKNIWQQI